MQISYLPTFNTCLIDDRKILLIAKILIENSEEQIKLEINFYKKFLNCDVTMKSNNEPNMWYFGQEIKLANFTDIIEQTQPEQQNQLEPQPEKAIE